VAHEKIPKRDICPDMGQRRYLFIASFRMLHRLLLVLPQARPKVPYGRIARKMSEIDGSLIRFKVGIQRAAELLKLLVVAVKLCLLC